MRDFAFLLFEGLSFLLASSNQQAQVVGLYRHSVKGLSADEAGQVYLQRGECFPDDRRFALLKEKNQEKFDPNSPEWLHKQNFLCAFSNPRLMAKYKSSYRLMYPTAPAQSSEPSICVPCDTVDTNLSHIQRILTIESRESGDTVFGPADLETDVGRKELGEFFSEVSNDSVLCVTANASREHTHQFGNTGSGVKARGDTRTVHIINANTVEDIRATLGVFILNPTRFRPNIVISGLEAWKEFDWVGKAVRLGDVEMTVIKQTVRCEGVSIDPMDPDTSLDIPGLLTSHYPQYGPYLGVYAVVETSGSIRIGDAAQLM